MKKIVLGTNNQDKLKELKRMFDSAKIEVLCLKDFSKCPDVIEDGKTFEANARKKARDYSKHTGLLTLADDSGLMVPCLRGKPGVYSARFAGPGCTYKDNNQKLLRLLKDKPTAKRAAKFVCVISIYNNGKFIKSVRGECPGKVALAEKGTHGFGYDPVFIPQGYTKTFSELSPATKNQISHRGKALRAAKKVVLKYIQS